MADNEEQSIDTIDHLARLSIQQGNLVPSAVHVEMRKVPLFCAGQSDTIVRLQQPQPHKCLSIESAHRAAIVIQNDFVRKHDRFLLIG